MVHTAKLEVIEVALVLISKLLLIDLPFPDSRLCFTRESIELGL
jgi:hypothetical protein